MRLFFALWPPERVAGRLAALAAECARRQGGSPTRQDTVHLTLSFLGDVPEERLPRLIEMAGAIEARQFEFDLDCVGYWKHHRLLWAGRTRPLPELGELVSRLQRGLCDAGLAVPDGPPPFFAHVTLARKVPDSAEAIAPFSIAPIGWTCDAYILVESRRTREGPDYRRIAEFALDARVPQPPGAGPDAAGHRTSRRERPA